MDTKLTQNHKMYRVKVNNVFSFAKGKIIAPLRPELANPSVSVLNLNEPENFHIKISTEKRNLHEKNCHYHQKKRMRTNIQCVQHNSSSKSEK